MHTPGKEGGGVPLQGSYSLEFFKFNDFFFINFHRFSCHFRNVKTYSCLQLFCFYLFWLFVCLFVFYVFYSWLKFNRHKFWCPPKCMPLITIKLLVANVISAHFKLMTVLQCPMTFHDWQFINDIYNSLTFQILLPVGNLAGERCYSQTKSSVPPKILLMNWLFEK